MMDGWDWFWGTLMMLVFWGGLTAVVVFAVRPLRAAHDGNLPRSRPTAASRTCGFQVRCVRPRSSATDSRISR
jgi:hypothetical protein